MECSHLPCAQEEVTGCGMVHASTGNIRKYIMAKVGTKQKYVTEITQQQSAEYEKLVEQLLADLNKQVALGVTDLGDLKAFASAKKRELLGL